MICPICGNNNNDNARFCAGCGNEINALAQQNPETTVGVSDGDVSSTQQVNTVPEYVQEQSYNNSNTFETVNKVDMKKRKPVFLWIGIAAIVLAAGIAITVFVMTRGSSEATYEDKMDLGRKYLLELDYDQAIVAFQEAIKIDPKKKDAYLELADAYVAIGEPEKALEILEEAEKNVDKDDREEINDRKKEIEDELENDESKITPEIPTEEPTPEITEEPTPEITEEPVPEIGNIGETVTFGLYEQDNNISNGMEPIEWIIISKDDSGILLLSKYALDVKPYNTEDADVTWENCTLRAWLNKEFYDMAFSDEEKEKIIETVIKNDNNPTFDTAGGNDTNDRVFILSLNEITRDYFNDNPDYEDIKRRCTATAYALAQGADPDDDFQTDDGKDGCWWWLRTPGEDPDSVIGVNAGGVIDIWGDYVDDEDNAIRPAIYIKLQ